MKFSTAGVLFFVLQLATIAFMATDIYIPSLPAIQADFKTTAELTQFSISLYLLTLGISQFFYGIFSDRWGRRPVILVGLIISCFGSALCVFAPTITFLLIGRCIQGAGFGFSISIGRAIVPDLYSEKELLKMASYVAMSIPLVMMISPVLGGYIQAYLGWRANFVFLLGYSLIFLALVYFYFPETNPHVGKHSFNIKTIGRHYKILLTSPLFIGYTLCFSCAIAGFIAYITGSPFLLQTLVGLSPVEYGWTIIATMGAGIIGGYLNVKMVNRFEVYTLIVISGLGMLLAGFAMVMIGLHYKTSLFSVILPIMFYMVMARMTTVNAYLAGSQPFRSIMGKASTIFGGIQLLLGSLVSTLIAVLPESNQVPLGLLLVGLSLISLLSIQLSKLKTKPVEL